MPATVTTGYPIDIRNAGPGARPVKGWATRKDAVAALAKMRATGHNCDPDVQVHRAVGPLGFRFWVLGLPNHHDVTTALTTDDGRWVVGRFYGGSPCFCATPCREPHPVPWVALGDELLPATFTHVTDTVPHAGVQRERYRTKSNGSCGRWVRTDDSVARCTCGFRAYTSTRDEARARARAHLADLSA